MALTRAMVREILSAAGVDDDHMSTAVKKIIDGNAATVDALQEEMAKYKTDADKLTGVQKELDELKAKDADGWQAKYNSEHDAFESYKQTISAEKVKTQKTELYRELLRKSKVDEKRINSILKITDLDSLTLTKDGKLDKADDLEKNIKEEWSGFIMNTGTEGANVADPPHHEKNAFEKMTLAEKMTYANEHPTEQIVIDWLKN